LNDSLRKVLYYQGFQDKRKFSDDVENNRVAYPLFELRGLFLGGHHSDEAKHYPADGSGANQDEHRV